MVCSKSRSKVATVLGVRARQVWAKAAKRCLACLCTLRLVDDAGLVEQELARLLLLLPFEFLPALVRQHSAVGEKCSVARSPWCHTPRRRPLLTRHSRHGSPPAARSPVARPVPTSYAQMEPML